MKLLSILKKSDTTRSSYFKLQTLKHFPSSTREWNNSIYLYNKNALPFIPHISKIAFKLIKSYFYIYNKELESFIRTKYILRKFRKLSTSKIFISKGEFKHTNNKVTVTLYIYNRQKFNFFLKLRKIYLKKFFTKYNKNKFLSNSVFKLNNKKSIIKIINKINVESFKAILEANMYKIKIIRLLNYLNKDNKISRHRIISIYVNKFYKGIVDKLLMNLEIYLFYKQLVYINKSKFNYTYLQYLKNYLQVLFNKNIEFNFINLKYFYLSSDILSDFILLKLKKDRRKMYRFLRNLQNNVKIKSKKKYSNKLLSITNLKKHFSNRNFLYEYIINNLKYRHISGFRLEAKGRLTKRYTASRSVFKLRYKGNLKNYDSSFRGLSTVLLKGNLKSNLQQTKLSSKTRIGSFGIKGWVSGN